MLFTDFSVRGKHHGVANITGDSLVLEAYKKTDWFTHPAGDFKQSNVISTYADVQSSVFTISALVSVDFLSAYDAGAIFIQVDDDNWAKLAFELSAVGNPTIVSVITRGTSDDADGPAVEGNKIWLRVHCDGRTVAFHFSHDGNYWHFLRWFSIPGIETRPLRVGFGVQAPTGEGCKAAFSHLRWSVGPLLNLRDGS